MPLLCGGTFRYLLPAPKTSLCVAVLGVLCTPTFQYNEQWTFILACDSISPELEVHFRMFNGGVVWGDEDRAEIPSKETSTCLQCSLHPTFVLSLAPNICLEEVPLILVVSIQF